MMSFASRGVRGFHKPNRLCEVCKIIYLHSVTCFGIFENKLRCHEINELKQKMGPNWWTISNVSFYFVCRILVLIDKESQNFNIPSVSDQYIIREL